MFFVHTCTPTAIIHQKSYQICKLLHAKKPTPDQTSGQMNKKLYWRDWSTSYYYALFDQSLPIKRLPKLILMSHISWQCLVYSAHCYFVSCVILVRPSARGHMGNCRHLSWKSANDTCNSWEYITWHSRALAPCAWLLLEGRPPTCSPNMLFVGGYQISTLYLWVMSAPTETWTTWVVEMII